MYSFLVSGTPKPISLPFPYSYQYSNCRNKINTQREYFNLSCVFRRHSIRFPVWKDKLNIPSGEYFGSSRNIRLHGNSSGLGGSSGGGNNSGHKQPSQGSDGGNNPFISLYLSYISALEERPVLTKAITTSFINALSDLIAQWLEQRGQSWFQWNLRRTFALGFWGLIFMGPFFHNWYLILERLFPSGRWAFLKKIVLDQTFAAAFFNITFFMGTGVLEGHNWHQIVDKLNHKFWPTMYANWKVWPLVQCITFTVIPLTFRVLWVNTVTVMWVIYFSSLAHSH
ncbi:hypothetical protein GpartN1_g1619.t1 [Galdieria partita]|uniref:Uncharacterized protein n=1 Tax=Galdieria partita TaxID=83374 RepID=A0A9C7PSC6_9RHOD|nr:hypothetical protein GpartN1_g1619.t1 [Galdieria partita]